ncbi:MAG: hypothetical protein HY716_12495 [Planctomycetes bacterium]|nr:hypothetical protein [Planctomycetota bacterium]
MNATIAGVMAGLIAWGGTQDTRPDPLKDLRVGDRVEISLISGYGFIGRILPEDPRFPSAKRDERIRELTDEEKAAAVQGMKVIYLDVSEEFAGLKSGRLGVSRALIRSARKLPGLTPAELEARAKAREQALIRMAEEDAARRSLMAEAELEEAKEREDAERRKKEREAKEVVGGLNEMLQKGKALFEKFPPSAGWGPEKIKELQNKTILRIFPTEEEIDFMNNYESWLQYKLYTEQQALKEEQKKEGPAEGQEKVEEKKKEETPEETEKEKKEETP